MAAPVEEDFFIGSKSDYEFSVLAQVAMSTSGQVVLLGSNGGGSISRILLSEFDNGVWAKSGMAIGNLDKPAMNVAIATSNNEQFIVVWQQSTGQFDQIYCSEFR